jgi:hypothetical protein
MRAEEFVTAYQRDCAAPGDVEAVSDAPADRLAAIAGGEALQHGEIWGMLLHDWLSGGRTLPADVFAGVARDFSVWFTGAAARMTALAVELGDEDADPAILAELTGFSFHRLQMRSLPFWRALLVGDMDDRSIREAVDRARVELSCDAVLFAQVREEVLGGVAEDTGEQRTFRAWHTGMLTEIDAMIGLLEATRRDPAVFVLPAPPQFERRAGAANADMIVVHRGLRAAGGVQVKASRSWEQAAHYDPERITMLDGTIHLQNVRAMRTSTRHADRRPVSWPGLVGANYLRTLPARGVDRRGLPRRQLLQLRFAARHHAAGLADHNDEVMRTCRGLALAALRRGGARTPVQVSDGAA